MYVLSSLVTEMDDDDRRDMPQLSKSQATSWPCGNLGMVLARSCASMAVSALLATWWSAKSRLCASSCVRFAMRRRPNAGPLARSRRGALLCAALGLGRRLMGRDRIGLGP